jgi:hypothetical protein
VVCSDQKEVESAFLSYFKNLFYAQRLEGLVGCLSGIKRTITPAMNTALLQPCTMEEVSIALLNMGLLSLQVRMVLMRLFSNKIGALLVKRFVVPLKILYGWDI